MARRTLSLPDELHARMEQVAGVNWSRVAQEAWTAECDRRERYRAPMSRIEELQEQRRAKVATDTTLGKQAGTQWASKTATYDALVAISELDLDELAAVEDPTSVLDPVLDAEYGAGLWGAAEAREFGESHFDDSYPNHESIAGFIDGAQEWFAANRRLIESD